MANFSHTLRILILTIAGASIAACAPIFANGLDWRALIGAEAAHNAAPPGTSYYESAVTAIDGRHYALALDYLQAARAQNPKDVRVENAFGVVYDKLGRFDLSARYYAKAEALDPNSTIVAENVAYSRRLQGLSEAEAATPVLADAARPQPRRSLDLKQLATLSPQQIVIAEPQTAATGPRLNPNIIELKPVYLSIRPDVPTPKARPTIIMAATNQSEKVTLHAEAGGNIILLTGHPLMVVNASGRSGAAKPVSASLSNLGWTVSASPGQASHAQAETMVMYHPSMSTVARALVRTLPFHARLVADNQTSGLRLVVGRNFLNFKPGKRSPKVWHKQIALAHFDAKKTGVR